IFLLFDILEHATQPLEDAVRRDAWTHLVCRLLLEKKIVGRLYDSQQMQHAFGVSTIPAQVALDKGDATLVWKDMGSPPVAAKDASATNPCEKNGCGINWSYVNMLGTAIQMAGANLNPLTFEH